MTTHHPAPRTRHALMTTASAAADAARVARYPDGTPRGCRYHLIPELCATTPAGPGQLCILAAVAAQLAEIEEPCSSDGAGPAWAEAIDEAIAEGLSCSVATWLIELTASRLLDALEPDPT